MWACWGSNENFHEGWYYPSIWRNIGLMFVQYLSPMLIVMLMTRWRSDGRGSRCRCCWLLRSL